MLPGWSDGEWEWPTVAVKSWGRKEITHTFTWAGRGLGKPQRRGRDQQPEDRPEPQTMRCGSFLRGSGDLDVDPGCSPATPPSQERLLGIQTEGTPSRTGSDSGHTGKKVAAASLPQLSQLPAACGHHSYFTSQIPALI